MQLNHLIIFYQSRMYSAHYRVFGEYSKLRSSQKTYVYVLRNTTSLSSFTSFLSSSRIVIPNFIATRISQEISKKKQHTYDETKKNTKLLGEPSFLWRVRQSCNTKPSLGQRKCCLCVCMCVCVYFIQCITVH